MSAGEIGWRLKGAFRDTLDIPRFVFQDAPGAELAPFPKLSEYEPPFRVSPAPIGQLGRWPGGSAWVKALEKSADQIQSNRLSFFDLEDVELGDPIDWHRDHASGKRAPRRLIQFVDYRNYRAMGDCKLVWEPNRQHQLVVLARAYRATGKTEYAKAVARLMSDWLAGNPFGRGMNWRSPLELAIRLINWIWALDLIKEADPFEPGDWAAVCRSVYQHCWEISRKYSRGSSANNHLIGEAAGVFVATSYFPEMPEAEIWRAEAKAILEEEIIRQTYSDGCTREHALGYQCFVTQFFAICRYIGELANDPFGYAYSKRLEAMFDFVAILGEGGPLPMFGDRDDGYVLDLGTPPDDLDAWLAMSFLMFARTDHGGRCAGPVEPAYWLYGAEGMYALRDVIAAEEKPLEPKEFESGYFLLQSGRRGKGQISVLFDCAELGYTSIAAHGHADALSIVVRADGHDFLIDPGTYDYFSFPAWRNYFRGTAAHNTIRIDGQDQSENLGPFMWGSHAKAVVIDWKHENGVIQASGGHDGYLRLDDPLVHMRQLRLDRARGRLEIVDKLECEGKHEAEVFFHLAPECTAEAQDDHSMILSVEDTRLAIRFDPALTVECREASDDDFPGWVSRGYHRKTASRTIVARGAVSGETSYTTVIEPVGSDIE